MDAPTRLTVPRSGALALVVAIVAVACAAHGGDGSGSAANGDRDRIVTPAGRTPTTEARTPTTEARTPPTEARARTTTTLGEHDGSLGDPDSKQACTLLTQAEIEGQFGGPVGEATPVYPYCQWLVGDDAFIAVTIYRQSIDEARRFHSVRFDTSGLGDDGGYIATTRAVFFGKNGVTYSILWQKVGDFTTVETDRLSALAQAVLGRV